MTVRRRRFVLCKGENVKKKKKKKKENNNHKKNQPKKKTTKKLYLFLMCERGERLIPPFHIISEERNVSAFFLSRRGASRKCLGPCKDLPRLFNVRGKKQRGGKSTSISPQRKVVHLLSFS